MSLQIAQAAVDDATIHFDKLYSYCIPPRLNDKVWPGSMVLVPFGPGKQAPDGGGALGSRAAGGRRHPKAENAVRCSPGGSSADAGPAGTGAILKDRTFCTWFEAVKAVIPYGAQYRAAVENGRPVMQNRLSRSTERLYTLAGELARQAEAWSASAAAMER